MMPMKHVARILLWLLVGLTILPNPAIAENKPVIPGTFSVSANGSSTYILPIRISPGAGGMSPAVSLVYDSQTLTSPLGAGWTLSGYSMITRGPRTMATDNKVSGVSFSSDDALFLDGQRLIPIGRTGAGAAQVTEYRKESDDVTRVTQAGDDLSNSTFEIKTKGGMTVYFDGSRNSRVKLADGSTLMMLQSSASDAAGNYFNFAYTAAPNGDYTLDEITYTGNRHVDAGGALIDLKPFASIKFEYANAPRVVPFYIGGRLIERTKRLVGITSRVATQRISAAPTWERFKRYAFDYAERETFGRYTLTSVHEYGRTDAVEAQPTNFAYSAPKTGWQPAPHALPAIVLAKGENLAKAYRIGKVSASASQAPDMMFSALVEGALESFTFENKGNGTWTRSVDELAPPVPFATSDGLDLGVELIDLNRDGKIDLLQSSLRDGATTKSARLVNNSKWDLNAGFELPFAISENGQRTAKLLFGNFSGGNGTDLLYHASTGDGLLKNDGVKWTPAPGLPIPISGGALALNVDCTGTDEVLARDAAGAFHVYRFQGGSWAEITDPTFAPAIAKGTPISAIRVVDLNQDQCPDLIVAAANGQKAGFAASSGGWAPSGKTPIFDLVDAAGDASDAVVKDLNNDGLQDLVAYRVLESGKTISSAYLQTAAGWSQAPASFVPSLPLSSKNGVAFLADIDLDGYPEAIFPTGGRTSFGEVLQGSAAGFNAAPNFTPPVAFARLDRQDRGTRFIDLNGDGLTDLLFNRKGEQDAKGAPLAGAYLNTAAGWAKADGLTPPLPLAGDDITGDPARFVDVDGDGYLDLLYAYRDASGTEQRKYYHNEIGANGQRQWVDQPGSPFIPPSDIVFAQQRSGDNGVQIVDVNGDGRPDLVASRFKPQASLPPGTNLQICTIVAGNQVCHWNPDFIQSVTYLNDGAKWSRSQAFDSPMAFVAPAAGGSQNDQLFVQLVDLNGDGLPELVARFKHPYDAALDVDQAWRNTGDGWAEDSKFNAPTPLDVARRNPKALAQWMDLNGDGIADLVYSERAGANNLSKTWLGTGAGFAVSTNLIVPLDAVSDKGGDPSFRLVDANGDGLADIIYSRRLADGTVQQGFFVNSGSAWVPGATKDVAAIPAVVDDRGQDLGVRFFDVNGDGLLDVIRSYAGTGSGVVVEQQALANTGRRADMMVSADAGDNVRTQIFYQSLQEPSGDRALAGQSTGPWARVYVPPATPVGRPLTSPTPVTYVVRRTVSRGGNANDIVSDYRYGDYLVDAGAMRSIGFGWREVRNTETGVLTRTEFSRDFRTAGRTVREATCLLPDNVPIKSDGACLGGSKALMEIASVWQVSEEQVGGGTLPLATVRQASLTSSTTTTWELDGLLVSKETTQLIYDNPASIKDRRLNVIKSETSRSDGTSLKITNYYGADDASRWLFGRLTRSTATKIGDVSPDTGNREEETRVSAFSYDSDTGLLASETADVGDAAVEVTKTYERDNYGNIKATTTGAIGLRRRVESTFDNLGRFETQVRRVTTARTFSTSTSFDRLSGAPVAVTDDDNQLVTTTTYDGYNRVKSVKAPNGLISTTDYLDRTEAPDPRLISGISPTLVTRTIVGSRPAIFSMFDGAGRKLRTAGQGFSPNPATDRLIIQGAEYDRQGRLKRQSLPYDFGGTSHWTTIEYDALDRRTSVKAPDGTIVQKAYSGRAAGGRKVTVTDALLKKTSAEYGPRGNLLSSTDARNGKITYGYDASDRLTLIVSPNGAKSRTFYSYGRKVRLVDPDMGNWAYKYDAFGQLTEQTDGNGTTLKMTYDELGRPLTRAGGNIAVSWEYDNAAHGVGQISRMVDTDKFEKSYTYDTFGRVLNEAVKIGGEPFTTSYDYDLYGKIIRVSYPTRPDGTAFNVVNAFDAKGAQYRVTDDQGTAYWQGYETNSLGQFTSERYGTSTAVKHTYDPETGRLANIESHSDAGSAILDLTLDYDVGGNLKRRREAVRSVDEKFGYDDLHRLTGMTDSSGTKTYTFDTVGRIRTKAGVGSYLYKSDIGGAWQPENAVLRITNGAQRRDLTYDNTGNLTKVGNRILKYDAAGRLVSITEGSASTTFEYDPNGERYRQVSTVAGTVTETIYVGSYERTIEYKVAAPASKAIRSRYTLASPSGVFAIVQFDARQNAALITAEPRRIWFVHRDNLGSVVRVTDETGNLAIRAWYDPWGKQVGFTILPAGTAFGGLTRSFTGQEQIFGGALIHMNGRVYDPETGMFIMADPIGNDATDTQGLGRYVYANDNPLIFIDPTGYWDWGGAIVGAVVGFVTGGPGGAVTGFILGGNDETREWIQQNWREVVIVGAAAAVTVATAGTSCAITCAIIAGAAGGATAGGLSAALYGGDVNDIVGGAIKGGIWGGITGGAMGLAGASTGFGSVMASGAVGGTVQAAQGGDFWKGFISAAVARASSVYIPASSSNAVNVARAAAVGGTTSSLSGGKFMNGAMSGAMSQAIAYASRHFGPTAQTQGGKGQVAFVGGAADDTQYSLTGRSPVRTAYNEYASMHPDEHVTYFTWDQSEDLAEWIKSNNGDVTIYAHSYGADTAAAVVGSGVQVKMLVTVDPVSRFGVGTPVGPSYNDVRTNAGTWLNSYSYSNDNTIPNAISAAGGAWRGAPQGIPSVNTGTTEYNHEEFSDLLRRAKGN